MRHNDDGRAGRHGIRSRAIGSRRLRAEARDERLARAARAARVSSRRPTNGPGIVVRLAGAGTMGGTD